MDTKNELSNIELWEYLHILCGKKCVISRNGVAYTSTPPDSPEERRKGMPRRFIGVRRMGGRKTSPLGTTSGFMNFVRKLGDHMGVAFGKKVLEDSRMFLDNASTHGAVMVDHPDISFMHQFALQCNFRGAIFAPVRDPKYNVAEQVFGYVKQHLRARGLPPSGRFTEATIMANIEHALMDITPAMVAAWTVCRGYRYSVPDELMPIGLNTRALRRRTGGCSQL